jgi:hypothetical protein
MGKITSFFGSHKWASQLKNVYLIIVKICSSFKQLHHMKVDNKTNKFKTKSQLKIFFFWPNAKIGQNVNKAVYFFCTLFSCKSRGMLRFHKQRR